MPLLVDFHFTPNLVTWDPDNPTSSQPIASVVLSENPGTSKVLLVGRNPREMCRVGGFVRQDRLVLNVLGLNISKAAVALAWAPGQGIEVTLLSKTHGLQYRTIGDETPTVVPKDRNGGYATRTVPSSHMALAIGQDGLWCTTRPTPDYGMAVQPGPTDPGTTPGPPNFADLFYCPARTHNAGHVMDDDDCDHEDHQAVKRRLTVLAAMHLPALDWPPVGFHLPDEKGIWKRRANTCGAAGNTTQLAGPLSESINQRARGTIPAHSVIPILLESGWIQPSFLIAASKSIKAKTGPVNWQARPAGMLGAIANQASPEIVETYQCSPGSREPQRC